MRPTSRNPVTVRNCIPAIVHRTILMALCLLAVMPPVHPQAETRRPSIGLVLSGGGAHGIAHLGVIKVMEEAGLRPDYITGVSMGSIIGGLYALGYSADSLYRILQQTDWNDIFTNRIPENKIIFLEKNNFYNSIFSLPTSSRKVTLPSGVINGQLIESMLGYYAWPAADISDFSKLPIPFMCVGADILTFRIADLRSGYLPDAIRASFAVPSIFTPVKIDTMLLVDGGLLRNFAASEAKEMGADILIGSYSGFQAYSEEELQSVSGIIKQIAFYRSLEDFNEQKKLVSYLVMHNLRNLPKTGFENVDSLFSKGYQAALPFREKFMQLADSLNKTGQQEPIENILGKKTYSFDRIVIEGNNIYSSGQILGILDIRPGQQVDKEMLRDRIELLYGKAWFEKVKYRIEPVNDSLILVLHCEEKPRGMFYGSVHYDNYLRAGINLGFSVKNLITNSSIININTCIAQFFRLDVNAIQFINVNQKFGFSATFNADNTLLPMFDVGGEKGDVISRNFIPGASINRYIGLNQLMSLSVRYESLNLVPQYNSERKIRNITYGYWSAGWNYHVNSLDSKYFPRHGAVLDLTASTSNLLSRSTRSDSSNTVSRITSDNGNKFERFFTVYGHFRYHFPVTPKLAFSVGGDALFISATDSISSGNNSWFLGGTESVNWRSIPLTGYHANEIEVDKMASLTFNGDLELIKDIHLQFTANAAAVGEKNDNSSLRMHAGYGIGLGYMSLIGPIRIGIMHGISSPEEYFNNLKGYICIGYKF